METEVIAHEAVREDTPEKEETEAAVLEEDGMMVIPETEKVASVEVLLDAETAQTNIPETEMKVEEGVKAVMETEKSDPAEVQDTQETEKEAMVGEAAAQEVGKVDIPEKEAEAQGVRVDTQGPEKAEEAGRRTLTEAKPAEREVMELNADGTAHLTGTARKNIPPEIEMMIQQAAQLNLELALTEANSLKKQKSKQLKFYEAEICISLTSQIALMKKSGLQTSLLSA